jgi:phospholipid/cholesterol/gamma-HCH transport system substrate-binding protein
MEREARYAAVGAFVLLVLTMAVLFVYWYSESHERRDYTRYEVYFEGSVSGLARGAPVRYLGVEVGRVVRMRIDPRNSSRVEVVVDIDSSAPVSQATLAELSLQGVTGLLYIDLIVSPAGRRLADAVPSLEYPVIRSARSNFDVVLASLPGLVGVVGDVADRLSRILSNQNIAAIGGALDNINQASVTLPKTLREIQALTAD